MKRGVPWNDDDSSSEESSADDTDTENVENDVASTKNMESSGTCKKKKHEGIVTSVCSCDHSRTLLTVLRRCFFYTVGGL